MNLVADESVDQQIVQRLRLEGYSVWSVAESAPSILDPEVLKHANDRQALLLTSDKDFGELVFLQKLVNYGVLLIRLSGLTPEAKADLVSHAFTGHYQELIGRFSVISPGSLRIRPGF